jgi:hypothetical protein
MPEKSIKSPESIYAVLNRDKKAMRLADFLVKCGVTVADCATASAEDWKMAAEGAGVRPPSKATIEIVVSMLKEREKPL